MRIAFDAKRIYQNKTGLGNYSRTLVTSLASLYPTHEYVLYAPKKTDLFDVRACHNTISRMPQSFLHQKLSAIWRSKWVVQDLIKDNIDLYHGLSHEIPNGIEKTKIKSVVTIHDLIFEKYPEQYKFIDRKIYRHKFMYACLHSDKIISVSEQTRSDIIELYGIEPDKIITTYQSCDESFYQPVIPAQKASLKKAYNLPDTFFLYVGSVIERKNLMGICKAYALAKETSLPPLVIVGTGRDYLKQVKAFIRKENIEHLFIFLSEITPASAGANQKLDLPTLYQSALGMIYPSVYEGFGIPVLEAMAGGTPVITSNLSCLPEVGGDAATYADPYQPESILNSIQKVLNDSDYVYDCIEKGRVQAEKFRAHHCAEKVMNVYRDLMNG